MKQGFRAKLHKKTAVVQAAKFASKKLDREENEFLM
jgi:hypothetical protein